MEFKQTSLLVVFLGNLLAVRQAVTDGSLKQNKGLNSFIFTKIL